MWPMLELLRAAWSGLTAVGQGLLAAWLLTMICVPILFYWRWGDRAIRGGITAGVVLQAATVLAVVAPAWGVGRTAVAAAWVLLLGWAVEFVGSRTGFPFGRYHYTGRLQPQLGRVPLLIPLAWLMMLPPAWAVADAITAGTRGPAFVVVSALAFTAWDLFLDPQMVGWHLWQWEQPGGYFGIPWVNFLGWALASAVMTAVVAPAALPGAPLLLVYGLTWALETVGLGLFWGQPQPAAVGAVGMGIFLLLALV